MNPTWFGFTRDLHLREDGAVTLDDALARARRVLAQVQPHYEWGEDALAATTFGLSVGTNYWVEFRVHQPNEISMHFEVPGIPWYRRLLRGRRANWRTLRSFDEMAQAIRHFFTLAPDQLDVTFRQAGAA